MLQKWSLRLMVSFVVLGLGATQVQAQAGEFGFKIGTYPTAMLSPVVGAIRAGLDAHDLEAVTVEVVVVQEQRRSNQR